MKKILSLMAALIAIAIPSFVSAQTFNTSVVTDTTIAARYIRTQKPGDQSIFNRNLQRTTLFVNEAVTSHVIMPENIKLVDISTDKVVGNQCADNIVRLKPAHRMYDNELIGTVSIIGERHIVQINVVYTPSPAKASAAFPVKQEDMRDYTNPDVHMSEGDMAKFCWAIYGTDRKFYGIQTSVYGIKAVVNNIYSIGDYFFVDFSLYNHSKVKYDIQEIRVKLTDKKETKATNSQTIEITPVYSLNGANSFKKAYRNVLVLDKLTFPDEKVLTLEVSENQISGRVITIPIEYADILHADGFSEDMMRHLGTTTTY